MAIIAISSELIFYCGGGKEFNFMYIIAGLGNPGKEYAGTRHNAGFAVIDALADKYNIDVDTAKHKRAYRKRNNRWSEGNTCKAAHIYESFRRMYT